MSYLALLVCLHSGLIKKIKSEGLSLTESMLLSGCHIIVKIVMET